MEAMENKISWNLDLLRTTRNLKEAKEFCDSVFGGEDLRKIRSHNDEFYKYFYEEYYASYLYTSIRYVNSDFMFCLTEKNDEADAEIIDCQDRVVERIQITSALFSKLYALQQEKLLRDGWALGLDSFKVYKDGTISQRGLRKWEPESVLAKVEGAVNSAVMKKVKIDYKNIDVLIVTYETPAAHPYMIKDYKKILEDRLKDRVEKSLTGRSVPFKEIFLLDYLPFLIKVF